MPTKTTPGAVAGNPTSAAQLRELALSRAAQLHPLVLVLDDQLRTEIRDVSDQLDQLQQARRQMIDAGNYTPAPPAAPASLADTDPDDDGGHPLEVDRLIGQCRALLADTEQRAIAAGMVLVVNFRRARPADYQRMLAESEAAARALPDEQQAQALTDHLGDALAAAGFAGCTTGQGDPVELTLDELRDQVMDHADLATMRTHLILTNREGAAVPFSRPSFGPPAGS